MVSKKWIFSFFFISFALVTSVFILIYFLHKTSGIPLRFTNSISYDAKLNFLQETHILEKADTLVIGSSMALNDINSKAIEEHTNKIEKIANVSSWGLQTSEIYELLSILPLNNVEHVIYSTQYVDFDHEAKKNLDKQDFINFLEGNEIQAYINTFNSFLDNFKTYLFWGKYHSNEKDFQYLKFNDNGDVNLDFSGKNRGRWNSIEMLTPKKKNYEYLIKINALLKKEKINFIVVLPPYREKLLDKNTPLKKIFTNHIKELERLSKKHNFKFVNKHKELHLNDDYFADPSHLNKKGAIEYSNSISKVFQ